MPQFWASRRVAVSAVVVAAVSCWGVTTLRRGPAAISVDDIVRNGGKALTLSDGRLLEYFEHGASTATATTTLLAIHGAQTTGNLFHLVDGWARDRRVRVISPTLPGFGLTPYAGPYQPDRMVNDLQHLMRHAAPEASTFYVVGTSLGSIPAAALASLDDRVLGVELYVSFAPREHDHDPLKDSMLSTFAATRRFPTFKKLFETGFIWPLMKWFMPKDGDVYRSIRWQWEGLSSCADIIYAPWAFDWRSMATRKDGGRRRVIIVSGSDDKAAPPHNQQFLHREIRGSSLVQYQGAHERSVVEPSLLAQHLELLFDV